MRSLDEITRDLAAVQDEILASDDPEQKLVLLDRQVALRAEARTFASQLGDARPSDEIRRELAERRRQLSDLMKGKIDLFKQSSAASGMAPSRLPEKQLNERMLDARGAPDLEKRIAELEQTLTERGEEA